MDHLYRYQRPLIWAFWLSLLPFSRAEAGPATADDLFFFCDLIFPHAVRSDPNTIHIPFTLAGRLITVEAQADTVSGNFIVDTGSEYLLLNKNHYREPRVGDLASIGNTGKVTEAANRWVDSLQWDNLLFKNILANVVDLQHIEQKKRIRLVGIIGYNVFRDFELFLDFQARQLVLTRLDKNGYRIDRDAIWETPYDSMDFNLIRHLIMIDAEVRGKALKFNLDSGAEVNLLDRKVPRKVLDDFEIIKRAKMVGVGQQEIEVLAGSLHNVRCGSQRAGSMRTLITNLLQMSTNFGTRIDGVIGYEFLCTRRTLINYKRKKLFFFRLQRP